MKFHDPQPEVFRCERIVLKRGTNPYPDSLRVWELVKDEESGLEFLRRKKTEEEAA